MFLFEGVGLNKMCGKKNVTKFKIAILKYDLIDDID